MASHSAVGAVKNAPDVFDIPDTVETPVHSVRERKIWSTPARLTVFLGAVGILMFKLVVDTRLMGWPAMALPVQAISWLGVFSVTGVLSLVVLDGVPIKAPLSSAFSRIHISGRTHDRPMHSSHPSSGYFAFAAWLPTATAGDAGVEHVY